MPNIQFIRFIGGGGSGSTGDHGLLTGLIDDDHVQYVALGTELPARVPIQILAGAGLRIGSAYASLGKFQLWEKGAAPTLFTENELLRTYHENIGNPLNDIVNTAAETDILSLTLRGGVLGTDSSMLVLAAGRYIQNTGVARTLTLRFKLGGTNLVVTPANSFATDVNWKSYLMWFLLVPRTATTEFVIGGVEIGPLNSGGTPPITMGARLFDQVGSAQGTVDHSVDQTLQLTAQHSIANASLSLQTFLVYAGMLPQG